MASEDIFADDYEGDASPPVPSQPEPAPASDRDPDPEPEEPITSSATPELRLRLREVDEIIRRNVLWTLGRPAADPAWARGVATSARLEVARVPPRS